MKKFFILFVALIGMISNIVAQDAIDQTGERTIKIGTYQMYDFAAPDNGGYGYQPHLGSVIQFNIEDTNRVSMQMVVVSVSSTGRVTGHFIYKVKCRHMSFQGRAVYKYGIQVATFVAQRTKSGNYVFTYNGPIQFFENGQVYDFSRFNGTYQPNSALIPGTGELSLKLVKQTDNTSTHNIDAEDRDCWFETVKY